MPGVGRRHRGLRNKLVFGHLVLFGNVAQAWGWRLQTRCKLSRPPVSLCSSQLWPANYTASAQYLDSPEQFYFHCLGLLDWRQKNVCWARTSSSAHPRETPLVGRREATRQAWKACT